MYEQLLSTTDVTSFDRSYSQSDSVASDTWANTQLEQDWHNLQEFGSPGRDDYCQLEVSAAEISGLNDQVRDLVGRRDVLFWSQHSAMKQRLMAEAGLKIGYPGQFIVADTTVYGGRKYYLLDPASDWVRDKLEFFAFTTASVRMFFMPIAEDETFVFLSDSSLGGHSTRYFFDVGCADESLVVGLHDGANWRQEDVSRLTEVSRLPKGWDSYGAMQIEPQVISHAREILEKTMDDEIPVPQIVPVYDGGIQLEWHTDSIDFEIHLAPSGKGGYFWEDIAQCEEHEGEIPDLEELRALLLKLKRTT